MRNIVLFPNPIKDIDLSVSRSVAEVLTNAGINVFLDRSFGTDLGGLVKFYDDFPKECELLLVIGGDGSVLDASVQAISRGLPILGVNLGKLGYLSEVDPENLSVLENLASDDFVLEKKILLRAEKEKDGKTVEVSSRFAVNDVVVSHESYLGISDLKLSCGDEKVSYRADGLIFATPAGSTAYSLSAGGPICSHDVDAVIVTPICAHTMFCRPIVISPNDPVSVENEGADPMHISIDGRHFTDLYPGESCKVAKAEKPIVFLTFKKRNMFTALFRKMNKLNGTN